MARLFSVVHNWSTSTNHLNEDLKKINDWEIQWQVFFNPDPTKQAQGVIFSRKIKKPIHTSLNFNKTIVQQMPFKGLILGTKPIF